MPVKGGGYPLCPLSFFEHNDFPLRGGGGAPGMYPPISLRKKTLKTAVVGQKTLILALLTHFFPLRGGGVPHLSTKGFLAKKFSVKGVGGGGTPLTEKIR